MQGRTWHPHLLHPGPIWWVLSPSPSSCSQRRWHVPACWGRTQQDGMKSHCCLLAPAMAPTPASSAVCSSRPWLPPKTLSASPSTTRSHSLGTEPAPGLAWPPPRAPLPAGLLQPCPSQSSGQSLGCVPSCPDSGASTGAPAPLPCSAAGAPMVINSNPELTDTSSPTLIPSFIHCTIGHPCLDDITPVFG